MSAVGLKGSSKPIGEWGEQLLLKFDILISLAAWAWAFIIPYGVGLGKGPGAGEDMEIPSAVVCALFALHAILFAFFKPYVPEGKLAYSNITSGPEANPHLKRRYDVHAAILDLCCCIPLDYVFETPITEMCRSRGWPESKIKYAVSLPALVMMVRLLKARRLGGGIRRSMWSGVQLIINVMLLAHFYACGICFTSVLPFLGELGERDGAATFWASLPAPFPAWTGHPEDCITDPDLPNYVPSKTRYIAALYFVAWNMLCVGMGDCKGMLNSERVLTCVIMITGGFVLSYTSGMGTATVQFLTSRVESLAARSRVLTQWVNERSIHPDLVDRLTADCEVSDGAPLNGLECLFEGVSKHLSFQARAVIAERGVKGLKLLEQLLVSSPDTTWAILEGLRMTQIPAGAAVVRQGDPPVQVAFLLQGSVNMVWASDPADLHNAAKQFVVGTASCGHAIGLAAALKAEPLSVSYVSTANRTVVHLVDSSVLYDLSQSCPKDVSRILTEFADVEESNLKTIIADVHAKLASDSALSASSNPNGAWAKLVVQNVIMNDTIVPLSTVPLQEHAFVAALPPKEAAKRMARRLTVRYPLAPGEGVGVWVYNYFGLHKKDDQLIHDEESEGDMLARGILDPNGAPRNILNGLMALAVLYTCITVPLYIGFDLEETTGVSNLGHFIDTLFFLDIVLTMRTAIIFDEDTADGRLDTCPWAIFMAYTKGGLLMDLVSTLPFDAMAGAGEAKLTRVIRLIRLTRLLKLARLAKLNRMLPALDKVIVRHPREFFFMSAMMQMIFLMHLLGCAFVFVMTTIENDNRPWWGGFIYNADGNMYMNPVHDTWITDEHTQLKLIPTTDLGTRYLAAFYWAASTATTTGVGDVAPATDGERAFNSAAILIGVIFYAYIAGLVAGMMTQGVATATKTALFTADFAARSARLPAPLRHRFNSYHRARLAFTTPFDEKQILADVPFTLRKDVVVFLNGRTPLPAALTGKEWRIPSVAHFDAQLIYECCYGSVPHWSMPHEPIVWKKQVIDEVIVIEKPSGPAKASWLSHRPATIKKDPKRLGSIAVAEMFEAKDEALQCTVLGLDAAAADETIEWLDDYHTPYACLYWAVPLGLVKDLATRYPDIAANVAAHARKGVAIEAFIDAPKDGAARRPESKVEAFEEDTHSAILKPPKP